MLKLLISMLFLISFTSCGKQVQDFWPEAYQEEAYAEDAVTEMYSYEFNIDGCHTGKQAASTFAEICTQLKDDSINKNCAPEEREDLYVTAECEGSF